VIIIIEKENDLWKDQISRNFSERRATLVLSIFDFWKEGQRRKYLRKLRGDLR